MIFFYKNLLRNRYLCSKEEKLENALINNYIERQNHTVNLRHNYVLL